MEIKDNIKILDVIKHYPKMFKNKDDVFTFLLNLKNNLEFSSSIIWPELFEELSYYFKDFKSLYLKSTFTPKDLNEELYPNHIIIKYQYNEELIETRDNHLVIKITSLEELKTSFNKLFNEAYSLPTKEFIVPLVAANYFDHFTVCDLFSGKIIPNNITMPVEYLVSRDLYYKKDKKYYKISKKNNNIIIVSDDIKGINHFELDYELIPNDVEISNQDEFINVTENILKELF